MAGLGKLRRGKPNLAKVGIGPSTLVRSSPSQGARAAREVAA
ncbi:hypothetical protein SAMN05877809_1154 [Rhodobacter sp. JA431]|nr:hypothetical protein SAMN05877809_1154 [Rhodobacter sp. JA431]